MSATILSAIDAALRDVPPPEDAPAFNDSRARGVRPATVSAVLERVGGLKLDKKARERVDSIRARIAAATDECARYSATPACVGASYKAQKELTKKLLRDSGSAAAATAKTKADLRAEFRVKRAAIKESIRELELELADAMRDALADLARRVDALAVEIEREERALSSQFHVCVPLQTALVIRKVSDYFRDLSNARSISASTLNPLL